LPLAPVGDSSEAFSAGFAAVVAAAAARRGASAVALAGGD
jgi:hypothetical protein